MSIVIPRGVWGARYSNGFAVIGTSAWEAAGREIWVHHSVTNPPGPNATLAQDCAHMREFEAIGQSRFGGGISYTWVIMPSGRVFEGHSIDRQGAHTYQRNDRSRAICFAGNYETNQLPDGMARSAALLLAELGATADGGHRDVYATSCPGQHAYRRIGEINSLSVAHRRGEINLSQEDDMPTPNDVWHGIRFGDRGAESTPAQWVKGANDHGHVIRYREIPALRALMEQTLAAVTNDPDITPEALRSAMDQAVAQHMPTPEQVAAAQRPFLIEVVRDALGQDDAEVADRIVDKLAQRLAAANTQES